VHIKQRARIGRKITLTLSYPLRLFNSLPMDFEQSGQPVAVFSPMTV
jgi:hypothetical protein